MIRRELLSREDEPMSRSFVCLEFFDLATFSVSYNGISLNSCALLFGFFFFFQELLSPPLSVYLDGHPDDETHFELRAPSSAA